MVSHFVLSTTLGTVQHSFEWGTIESAPLNAGANPFGQQDLTNLRNLFPETNYSRSQLGLFLWHLCDWSGGKVLLVKMDVLILHGSE